MQRREPAGWRSGWLLAITIMFTGCDSAVLDPGQSLAERGVRGDVDQGADPEAETFVPGRLLLKFKPGASDNDKQRSIDAAGGRVISEIGQLGVKVISLPANASEVAQARAFGRQAQIEFAEPDYLVPPATTPNDVRFADQWYLPKIACPDAWSAATGSSAVTIAILDTGCDPTHPDLASKYVPGWNCYDNNSSTADVYNHGTGVAGLAAAYTNNLTGMAGASWGCKIMPIRVCNSTGLGSASAMAQGLVWAADHGARVANISYEASSNSTVTEGAQYFQSKGGVVVVAAGNYAAIHTNLDNPYVLTVSATNEADGLASWSDSGSDIDLSAPGENIFTTGDGGGYVWGSGTSYSAPLTAGVAALVVSVNPSLNAQQIQDVLKQSADDLGSSGRDAQFGWGRLNAARAVALAALIPPPTADTTPPTVGVTAPVAAAIVSGLVGVQAAAADNVGVAGLSLNVDGAPLGTDATSPYSFAWNTSGYSNGSHVLMIVASDAAGNSSSASVNVLVNNVLADTSPPSISITTPANGSSLGHAQSVSVMVAAGDNTGVSRVELHVDGVIKSTSTTAPFTTQWNAKKASAGAHTLRCKAFDAAGNVGLSSVVTVYK